MGSVRARSESHAPRAGVTRAVRAARGRAIDADPIIHGMTTVASAIANGVGRARFCLSASTSTGRGIPSRIVAIGEAAGQVGRPVYE